MLIALTACDEESRRKKEIITSIPGVGPTTAHMLIAGLPELGKLGGKQIAPLLGVAPFNRNSGALRSYRSIFGGREAVRRAMYNRTALGVATRNNPLLKAFYQKLLNARKKKKVRWWPSCESLLSS